MSAKPKPRRGSPLNLPGAFELFGKSYGLIKKNFEVFMVLFAVGGLMALWDTLGRYVGDEKVSNDWNDIVSNGFFGPQYDSSFYTSAGGFLLFFFVLFMISRLLLTIASLRAVQGHQLSLKRVWKEFTNNWLWLRLIAATVVVGLLTIIGFFLLVVPGVILLWKLFFVPYLVIDQNASVTEAIRRSWEMSRGFAWPVYSVILVSFLLGLTSIIPIAGSLIAFVLTSTYTIAPALRYEQIKKLS